MSGNISNESNRAIVRGLELLAVGVVTASLLGLVAMRLGIFSAPQIWLATIIIAFVYHWTTRHRPVPSFCAPTLWQMALVIAVGLLFRLPPYANVLGGTDDATYVNMGMELARTGALAPVDHVLEHLKSPALQQLYKSTSYLSDRVFLPGVYSTEKGLVFQFYPLFPIWLALFELRMGVQVEVYALTFLSIVSLVYFQCLACLLTRSKRVGLIAGLLLAINPLHTFVSKLTVSEMTLLAHSLISFFLLLTFCHASENGGYAPKRLIWVSALALGMAFMTRINGFLYLPFLLTVFLSVRFFDENPVRRGSVMSWAVASAAFYFVSAWYGLTWSAPYANDIYRLSFEPRFGTHWPLVLGLLGVAVLAGCWGAILWSRRASRLQALRRCAEIGFRLLPYLLLLAAAVSLYKAYEVGFTDTYANDSWIQLVGNLSHHGWDAVRSTSLLVVAAYLSPFIFIAFFISTFRRHLPPTQKLLLIFVACFFCNYCIILWFIGSVPAVHRYLLSELVPGVLLFTVCALGDKRSVRTGSTAILLALGVVWCLGFSLRQFGKKEGDGALQALDEIAKVVDSKDVLLLSTEGFPAMELQVPLDYSYRLNTLRIDRSNLCNTDYLSALRANYNNVYLLSDVDNLPPGFEFEKSVQYAASTFTAGNFPPTAVVKRHDQPLQLHHLLSISNSPLVVRYDAVVDRAFTQTGEVSAGMLRNNGKSGFLLYGPYKCLSPGEYRIDVRGRITNLPAGGFVRLDVASNGGRKLHGEAVVNQTTVLPSFDFTLTQAVDDVEIRFWAEQGVDIEVEGYRVYRKSN